MLRPSVSRAMVLVAALTVLASCAAPIVSPSPGTPQITATPEGSAPASSAPATATSPASTGDRIVVAFFAPPFASSPFLQMSNALSFRPPSRSDLIVQLLYNGVYRYNESLDVVPDLAAKPCDIAADKVTITCSLVDARFHDGTPLTADDVVFTYELVRDQPETCASPAHVLAFSTCLDMLESVTAVDEHTVQFTLKAPNATFLTLVLPNVMIDSRANIEAAYQPLADRAATLDPADFEQLATQINDDLASDAPACDKADEADALMASAGLPVMPRDLFAFDGGPFDACLYVTSASERLAAVAASLRTTGLGAIAAAYPALSSNQHPVGTGPFRLVGMTGNNRARFDAYADYHLGRPAANGFEVVFTHDPGTIKSGLLSGEIDWFPAGFSGIIDSDIKDLPGFQFASYPAPGYGIVGYNLRPGSIFEDHAIRSALELCIDKEASVAAATNGEGDLIYSPVDPISWAFQPNLLHIERNVDEAKSLIEGAGWTLGADGVYVREGQRLAPSVLVPASDTQRTTFLDVIADQVKDCGIELKVVPADSSTVLDKALTWPHLLPGTDKPFDAAFIIFGHGLDPDDMVFASTTISSAENPRGFNFMGYSNPEVDNLLAEGLATYDQRERARIYREYQDVLARDQPVLFTWGQRNPEAIASRLRLTDRPINLNTIMWWWELEKLTLAP